MLMVIGDILDYRFLVPLIQAKAKISWNERLRADTTTPNLCLVKIVVAFFNQYGRLPQRQELFKEKQRYWDMLKANGACESSYIPLFTEERIERKAREWNLQEDEG